MEKSLEKALNIYTVLATGKSISSADKETSELYNAFYADSEVYDITMSIIDKLGLKLYEHSDSIFVTAGHGNKVFGYTNDDLKKRLGLRLNRELYLVYFIIYEALLQFYRSSDTYQIKDYIRIDELIEAVTNDLKSFTTSVTTAGEDEDEKEKGSFREIAILWDSLPPMISEDKDRNKASRGSRMGYTKLASNFMGSEGIFTAVDDRLYPTQRFHAIAENYFEDNGSLIYEQLSGGKEDAEH
ncbi:MAG: hypothetical protein J5517_02555 [Eubacterium sp.]|nr:hypothetical protein [Eubacterium sp.]